MPLPGGPRPSDETDQAEEIICDKRYTSDENDVERAHILFELRSIWNDEDPAERVRERWRAVRLFRVALARLEDQAISEPPDDLNVRRLSEVAEKIRPIIMRGIRKNHLDVHWFGQDENFWSPSGTSSTVDGKEWEKGVARGFLELLEPTLELAPSDHPTGSPSEWNWPGGKEGPEFELGDPAFEETLLKKGVAPTDVAISWEISSREKPSTRIDEAADLRELILETPCVVDDPTAHE